MVKTGETTGDSITRRMRLACCRSKATDTRTRNMYYLAYCFSTETMVTRTRHSVTLCGHCLSCFSILNSVQSALINPEAYI
jgi:hypothetical protein